MNIVETFRAVPTTEDEEFIVEEGRGMVGALLRRDALGLDG